MISCVVEISVQRKIMCTPTLSFQSLTLPPLEMKLNLQNIHLGTITLARVWSYTCIFNIPFILPALLFYFQVAYSSPHYGGQRVGGSPQAAASPHLSSASPQVPSPQGQTLDLSVSRLSHRSVHKSCIIHDHCETIHTNIQNDS